MFVTRNEQPLIKLNNLRSLEFSIAITRSTTSWCIGGRHIHAVPPQSTEVQFAMMLFFLTDDDNVKLEAMTSYAGPGGIANRLALRTAVHRAKH